MISRISSYEVVDLLGDGGMGAVYRARDPRFDRDVAVKVLHAQYQRDAGVVDRFKSEAVIQAKLSHPHIVTVLDFIADGDALAMVMEHVEGRPLDRVIADNRGPMDPDRVVRLMSQVLGAMGYAHSKGLVHRDIKPSNIMVQEVGGQEFAKVMDFGIAKILGAEKFKTATGAKMGTLAYMSPEHVKSPKYVDVRSDVYSLGVVLYQMLTGRVPFDADSEYDLMRQIVETPPDASLVPASLRGVVQRAVEKKPDARYPTCDAMAKALNEGSGFSHRNTVAGSDSPRAEYRAQPQSTGSSPWRPAPSMVSARPDPYDATTKPTISAGPSKPTPWPHLLGGLAASGVIWGVAAKMAREAPSIEALTVLGAICGALCGLVAAAITDLSLGTSGLGKLRLALSTALLTGATWYTNRGVGGFEGWLYAIACPVLVYGAISMPRLGIPPRQALLRMAALGVWMALPFAIMASALYPFEYGAYSRRSGTSTPTGLAFVAGVLSLIAVAVLSRRGMLRRFGIGALGLSLALGFGLLDAETSLAQALAVACAILVPVWAAAKATANLANVPTQLPILLLGSVGIAAALSSTAAGRFGGVILLLVFWGREQWDKEPPRAIEGGWTELIPRSLRGIDLPVFAVSMVGVFCSLVITLAFGMRSASFDDSDWWAFPSFLLVATAAALFWAQPGSAIDARRTLAIGFIPAVVVASLLIFRRGVPWEVGDRSTRNLFGLLAAGAAAFAIAQLLLFLLDRGLREASEAKRWITWTVWLGLTAVGVSWAGQTFAGYLKEEWSKGALAFFMVVSIVGMGLSTEQLATFWGMARRLIGIDESSGGGR